MKPHHIPGERLPTAEGTLEYDPEADAWSLDQEGQRRAIPAARALSLLAATLALSPGVALAVTASYSSSSR